MFASASFILFQNVHNQVLLNIFVDGETIESTVTC